jgi:hypothetical protein
MKESLNRYNVFYGILLVALIIIGEVGIYYLKMPGWPMFAALVLFFLGHLEVKNIPAIFIGGLVGIICSVLLSYLIILLDPILGNFIPTLIFIGTFVFLIVLYKDVFPWVFNSYAFMFFLMTGMARGDAAPSVLAVIMLLGGGFMIGGTLIINKIMEPLNGKN